VDSLSAGQVIGQLRLHVLIGTRSLHDLADDIHHQRRPVPTTAAIDDDEFGVRRETSYLRLRWQPEWRN
jgi:hypothetical protein